MRLLRNPWRETDHFIRNLAQRLGWGPILVVELKGGFTFLVPDPLSVLCHWLLGKGTPAFWVLTSISIAFPVSYAWQNCFENQTVQCRGSHGMISTPPSTSPPGASPGSSLKLHLLRPHLRPESETLGWGAALHLQVILVKAQIWGPRQICDDTCNMALQKELLFFFFFPSCFWGVILFLSFTLYPYPFFLSFIPFFFFLLKFFHYNGVPGGTVVKGPPASAETNACSIPGSGRSPGGGRGNPLQYSCLENSVDTRAWWAAVPRVAKRLTQLSIHTKRAHS